MPACRARTTCARHGNSAADWHARGCGARGGHGDSRRAADVGRRPVRRRSCRRTPLRRRRDRRNGERADRGLRPCGGRGAAIAARNARHALSGSTDQRRVRRCARPLRPAARYRCRRQAAARMADRLHVSGGSAFRRRRLCAADRRALSGRERAARHHDRRGVRHRASPVGRRAVRGGRAARAPAHRRQGPDGPPCGGRPSRHRDARLRREQGPDRALARARPSRLCRHAPIRRNVVAGATRGRLRAVARNARCLPPVARRGERRGMRVDRVALPRASAVSRRLRPFRTARPPRRLCTRHPSR